MDTSPFSPYVLQSLTTGDTIKLVVSKYDGTPANLGGATLYQLALSDPNGTTRLYTATLVGLNILTLVTNNAILTMGGQWQMQGIITYGNGNVSKTAVQSFSVLPSLV